MEKRHISLGRGGERKQGVGRNVKLKMFSAVSLGERKGVLFAFFLTKATQEENNSLRRCML